MIFLIMTEKQQENFLWNTDLITWTTLRWKDWLIWMMLLEVLQLSIAYIYVFFFNVNKWFHCTCIFFTSKHRCPHLGVRRELILTLLNVYWIAPNTKSFRGCLIFLSCQMKIVVGPRRSLSCFPMFKEKETEEERADVRTWRSSFSVAVFSLLQ